VSLTLIQKVAVWILPVVLAITLHEAAHGWMAMRLGDRTAQMLGRLTLNPIKHVDPIGTVLVPGALLVLGGLIFGWARPVPVTVENLRNPRRDMAWVALAGPGANLVMGLGWALVARAGLDYHRVFGGLAEPMVLMGVAGIFINSILLVLNLLPLPPLDGGRVLASILPGPWAYKLSRVEPYGMVILLALLALGVLGLLLSAPMHVVGTLLLWVAGVPAMLYQSILAVLLGVV